MKTIQASCLQIGDVILPPAREIRLWMKKDIQDRGLPVSALAMTIIEIKEGRSDKGGRWIIFRGEMCEEWHQGKTYMNGKPFMFTFKARPTSDWAMFRSVAVA